MVSSCSLGERRRRLGGADKRLAGRRGRTATIDALPSMSFTLLTFAVSAACVTHTPSSRVSNSALARLSASAFAAAFAAAFACASACALACASDSALSAAAWRNELICSSTSARLRRSSASACE